MERRRFLKAMGAVACVLPLESALEGLARAQGPRSALVPFRPLPATDADDVLLPEGFRYDVVLQWGDPFTASGETFGYNNDFIGVFPLGSDEEALLVVNHEYVSVAFGGDAALYPETFRMLRGRTPSVRDFKHDVGISVVRVVRDAATGAWRPVPKDRFNRRIDAFTPCAVDGPAAPLMGARLVEGTFDNCSGQVTPWKTALSGEENFQARVLEAVDTRGRSLRGGLFDLPGGHYGWIVEVDPFDPHSRPVKHTALGRFRHENVGLRARPGQPVAAYMGDDRTGGHVWKFLSAASYRPGDAGAARRLLSEGVLHVARFHPDGTGEWRPLTTKAPLDPNPDPADLKPEVPRGARRLGDVYASLGAMVMDAYRAANLVGGSPAGRPEDLEVHPTDGSVFIAFTAQSDRPGLWTNVHGEIWRLEEEDGDPRSSRFRWSRFAVGGPPDAARTEHVFTQPDNMLFDARGDLWFTTDLSSDVINAKPPFDVFRNSSLFHVPVTGPDKGLPSRFASMPCEAEPTGPAFAPGEQALFLSVQHPGERWGVRKDAADAPRGSNWPSRRLGEAPRPAVIAMRRL